MRLVIHVGGGSGHLRPVIPIAVVSQRRGHQVVIAAEGALRLETESFGLGFAELPRLSFDEEAFKREMEQTPEKDRPRMVLSGFFRHAANCSEALSRVVDGMEADLILRGTVAWAAIFAGEKAGIPVASFDFSPGTKPIVAEVIGDLFADYRRTHKLPPDPELTALDRWLNLVGGPPEWFTDSQLSATTHLIQPPDPDAYPGETIGSLLSGLDGRPVVYATLGTTFNDEPFAWPTLLEALAAVDANVIATLGRGLDPNQFGSQPPNIRLTTFVSQSLILPHCAAMVAHGGYGSLMAALRHGLPAVSLPAAAIDNQRNAARLAALGAGIAIPSASRTPDSIADAVTAVLSGRTYRSAAEAIATSIRSLPTTDEAVDLLERLATEHEPLVRLD